MKKIIILTLGFVLLIANVASARDEGFYIGGGYQQPMMYTWKKQSIVAPNPGDSIRFWPGFGAFIEPGYYMKTPDWLSFALPISWSYMRLNKTEWVQLFNGDAAIQFHTLPPENRLDLFFSVLAGFNYLTEGKVANDSASIGPDFGGSIGINYSIWDYALAGRQKVHSLMFTAELPVKMILYVNDYDLSDSSMTPVLTFPLKLGMKYLF